MLIFVGASASGKTELAYYLRKNYGYQKCITTTTRPKRDFETDGVDYHFLNLTTFQDLIQANAFIETNEYHGYWYGLQKKDMLDDSILILDPNGANHITQAFPDQVFVCYVSSSKETRQKRMYMRKDNKEAIVSRISEDDNIFDINHLSHVHYVLENENKSIDILAQEVHEAYQAWKKEKSHDR